MKAYGAKQWIKIQAHVPGRTDMQCRERWVNILNPVLNNGPWTEEVFFFFCFNTCSSYFVSIIPFDAILIFRRISGYDKQLKLMGWESGHRSRRFCLLAQTTNAGVVGKHLMLMTLRDTDVPYTRNARCIISVFASNLCTKCHLIRFCNCRG